METYFNDIKIVALDEELTQKSLVNPSYRQIFFRLSLAPDRGWIFAFNRSRSQSRPRLSPTRKVHLEQRYIVVDCPLQEVENHLNDLKIDVAQANAEFRAFLNREIKEELAIRNKKADEVEQLRSMKYKLNFND